MTYSISRDFPFYRGRKLRSTEFLRDSVAETKLSVEDLVMPYFIRENDDKPLIHGMPGIKRLTENELIEEIKKIKDLGVKMIAIFPKVSEKKKTTDAKEALNENNLICRVLRKVKKQIPEMITICDVALDAYTKSGHDGVLNKQGIVDNDKTIKILAKMSFLFASNDCDVIAPSDMMDGRVKVIREYLEKKKLFNTCILSYSSKFCSNFYSPFRDALGSKKNIEGSNKKTYQIDFRNRREAIKESLEDIKEGADILMVKPAGYYLDIIRDIKEKCLVPIAAYQVSGEYSMIKKTSESGIIDYKNCVLESLYCIKRSGADLIFSYFTSEAAKWLKS